MPALGIPCRCPLPITKISVPKTSIAVPTLPPSIPSWLTEGDYQVSIAAPKHKCASWRAMFPSSFL